MKRRVVGWRDRDAGGSVVLFARDWVVEKNAKAAAWAAEEYEGESDFFYFRSPVRIANFEALRGDLRAQIIRRLPVFRSTREFARVNKFFDFPRDDDLFFFSAAL